MTDQETRWIQDVEGVKACVPAADYGLWVRVHGWTPADPPTGLEFQWIRNADHGGRGVLNHSAALLHEGLGWFPSDPPPPVGYPDTPAAYPAAAEPAPAGADLALARIAGPAIAAAQAQDPHQSAAGGDETEQVNG